MIEQEYLFSKAWFHGYWKAKVRTDIIWSWLNLGNSLSIKQGCSQRLSKFLHWLQNRSQCDQRSRCLLQDFTNNVEGGRQRQRSHQCNGWFPYPFNKF